MTIDDRLRDWFRKPYDDSMSVVGWFAFFALIGLISLFWSKFLKLDISKLQGFVQ